MPANPRELFRIGRELLRLRPRQHGAVAQCVQEARLADPALFLDDDAVHHRDLPGRAAEAERRDPQPDSEGVAEADAVRRAGGRVRWFSPCSPR